MFHMRTLIMDIEIGKRFTSKSVTTALLIILTLTGTGMTAAAASSVYTPASVYAQQQQATVNVRMSVQCNPAVSPPSTCPTPGQFQIGVRYTIQDSSPVPPQFAGSAAGTIVTINPSKSVVIDVQEFPSPPPGYELNRQKSALFCTSGPVNPGDQLVCNLTAVYESTTLRVRMNVVCNPAVSPPAFCPSPSSFTIGIQGFANPVPSQFQSSPTDTNVRLGPGSYLVRVIGGPSGGAPPGYAFFDDHSRDCDGRITGIEDNSRQCVITRTYFIPSTLTVRKQIDQTTCPQGSTCLPSQFFIRATGALGASPNGFQGSSTGTQVTLGPGKYSITEEIATGTTNPPGLVPVPTFSNSCNGVITTAGQQLADCVITNRYLPDTDGDGLANTWETNGIDINGDNSIDLRLPGANANHKNIYIETDYMELHRPFIQGLENTKTSFRNAPVTNPDNVNGITLDYNLNDENNGQGIPHQDLVTLNFLQDRIKPEWFGTEDQRNDPNAANILAAKKHVYHYALFAHMQTLPPNNDGSAGVGDLPGMNFLMSFGKEGWEADLATGHPVGTPTHQGFTYMHELGHNIGLLHGGFESAPTCKPNYLSAMNYLFSLGQFVADSPLDFSRSALDTLNENSLNEQTGFSASTPPGRPTIYNGPGPEFQDYRGPRVPAPTGERADFNFDGIFETSVTSDINGNLACRDPSPGQTLVGFNDWGSLLVYSSLSSRPNPAPATEQVSAIQNPAPTTEQVSALQFEEEEPDMPTIAEVRLARAALLEGINNAILRLIESHPEIEVGPEDFDTGLIVEYLFADQLDKAIEELVALKDRVIEVFGQQAADEEVVPQIQNLVDVLETQKFASHPPASDCTGVGNRNSVIIGTPDPDTLIGTNGQNTINGLGEGDRIHGCGANDRIMGSTGNDGIAGGSHNDDLSGNDGDDVIQGDSGNDRLAGGTGLNYLTGGSGRDAFICDPQGETYITDFEPRTDSLSGPCILPEATTNAAQAEISTASTASTTSTSAASSSPSIPLEILPLPLPS